MTSEGETSGRVAELLVGSHRQFLGFLQSRLADRALAEDILQDAFVKSIEKAGDVREETAVAWFYQLLRNAVIDHHRRGSVKSRALEKLAGEMKDAFEPPPDVRGAICACVGELAGTLKPEYADAIRRMEVDGISTQQYASEAGITPGNAAVRAFRAREALRKKVRASCRTCAEHGCLECSCSRPASNR